MDKKKQEYIINKLKEISKEITFETNDKCIHIRFDVNNDDLYNKIDKFLFDEIKKKTLSFYSALGVGGFFIIDYVKGYND